MVSTEERGSALGSHSAGISREAIYIRRQQYAEWHQPKVETAFQPNDMPLYYNICICVSDSARGFKLTMNLHTSVPVATDAMHWCVPHMGNTRVHSHVLT